MLMFIYILPKLIDGNLGTDRRKFGYRFTIIDGYLGTDRRIFGYRLPLKKVASSLNCQGLQRFLKNPIYKLYISYYI